MSSWVIIAAAVAANLTMYSVLKQGLPRIGWTCGCWTGYPNKWYKRTALVQWMADRFDPCEMP